MQNIKISDELSGDIINWMRAQMYNEWSNANTMRSEEEYYKLYFSNALDIIQTIQEELNKI